MNLVGKIFVVLIFIMSVVLMSLTVSVYSTHTNWRFVVENTNAALGTLGYKPQLEASKKEAEDLRKLYTDLENKMETERATKISELTSLRTVLQAEQEKRQQLEAEVSDLRSKSRDSIAATNTAQAEANRLAEQNDQIRDQIQVVVKSRDDAIKQHIMLRDEFNEAVRKTQDLQRRSESLVSELGAANSVLQYLGLVADVNFYMAKEPAAGVEGRVLAVNSDRKLVEISVGSDDSVNVGHRFEIHSRDGSQYLGRVVVTDIYPDKAVCSNVSGFENGVYAIGNRAIPVRERVGR